MIICVVTTSTTMLRNRIWEWELIVIIENLISYHGKTTLISLAKLGLLGTRFTLQLFIFPLTALEPPKQLLETSPGSHLPSTTDSVTQSAQSSPDLQTVRARLKDPEEPIPDTSTRSVALPTQKSSSDTCIVTEQISEKDTTEATINCTVSQIKWCETWVN